MEFKKVPKRSRPQSAPPSPSHTRSAGVDTKQNTPIDRSQPLISGRSQKNASLRKKRPNTPLVAFVFSKKSTIFLAISLVVVIGLLLNRPSSQNSPEDQASQSDQRSSNSTNQTRVDNKATTPTYDTVTPNGKNIEELGGWQRVSPATSTPVFAYTDKIGEVSINVSQQPLPDTFKNDIDDKTADLAKKFNATTSFNVGSTKAYIGTSAKGPQSVIFTTEKLLILIKSQKNIDTNAWSNYIKSLT